MASARRTAQLGLGAALLLLIACFAVVVVGLGRSDSSGAALPGAPARNFRLPDLNDHVVSLGDLRGRVVVMYFAGLASEPVYDPMLIELARQFQNESRVAMLAVYPEPANPAAGIAAALRLHTARGQLPLATLIDPTLDVSRIYRVDRDPTCFVIDQSGVIRFRGVLEADGPQDQILNQTRHAIETLLSSAADESPVS
jgi:peroxiredoxin